jgi:hypothetical protein
MYSFTIDLDVPAEGALIVQQVLLVDRPLTGSLRNIKAEPSPDPRLMTLQINVQAPSLRLVRTATNGILQQVELVLRTLQRFGPDNGNMAPRSTEIDPIQQ